MTDYQERRLNSINFRIENQLESKTFIPRNYKRISFFLLFFGAGVVCLGYSNDKKRLESPETYDYSTMIYEFIGLTGGLFILVFIVYLIMYLQSIYLIKQLEKEEQIILDAIERNRMDFERYENFDEIGDEE